MSDKAHERAGTPATAAEPFLQVTGLSRRFGGLWAVKDVSFSVAVGEIMALIGPNGAGKSTIVNLLSGADKPTSGRILVDGAVTEGQPTHLVAARGLVRTFQNGRLFTRLSVQENVLVGCHRRYQGGLLSVLAGLRSVAAQENALAAEALALLEDLDLAGEADTEVYNLPYGKQRKLEIARAMISRPRMILLDEPAAGLNSAEVRELATYLDGLRKRGLGILLIEHNMGFVSSLADRITVLNFGEKIAEGHPADVLRNELVVEAYLGKKRHYAQV